MHNPKYIISFFNGIRDKIPKREDLTFHELRIWLSKVARKPYTAKDELEGMICGEFAENKRAAEHLTFRSIITYDIDNYKYNLEKLISDCELCLKDIKYLYYTTISNTYSKPRIRILIFPNKNIEVANYSRLVKSIAEDLFSDDILEGLDKTSYSPMQLMFLPSLNGPHGGDFECKAYEGHDLEINKYSKDITISEPGTFVADFKNVPLPNFNDEKVWQLLEAYNVEETGYYDWFMVCQALHHQYSGGEKGLEFFIKWSKQDRRYRLETREEDCTLKYRSINALSENPITLASIVKLVKDKKKCSLKGVTKLFEPINKKEFVDVKENKKGEVVVVHSTYTNFEIMCKHYKIEISYDVISKENVNSFNETNQNNLVSIIRSALVLNGMDRSVAIEYINYMASNNKINSFKKKLDLENIKWDKVDRLNDFYNTLKVDDEYIEIRNLYLLKWLQQMLYLTLEEGPRKIARNLLVLQSDQCCGKSTWLKSLLPEDLSSFIGEGLHLNTNNDMSVLSCIKNIFVELAELEQSFKTTDINQFKAFFGRTKDTLNIKYLACPESFTRTTSFLGTVNEVSFLKDKTGSTRFLVLPIKKADGFHRIDMMQLYRQIIETKGYIDFELNEDEQKKQKLINEEFQQPDVIEEQFTSFFEIDFKEGGNYQNCTQILEQLGHSKRDINYAKRCDIANTLRKYKFDYQKKTKRWKVKLKEATKKVNKEENEDEF